MGGGGWEGLLGEEGRVVILQGPLQPLRSPSTPTDPSLPSTLGGRDGIRQLFIKKNYISGHHLIFNNGLSKLDKVGFF